MNKYFSKIQENIYIFFKTSYSLASALHTVDCIYFILLHFILSTTFLEALFMNAGLCFYGGW